MRRLTRGIGLFGGPGATMTAKKVKLPSVKPAEHPPHEETVEPPKPEEAEAEEPKGWLSRLFGSDDDPQK
jgi:hypothetical protein